MKIFKDKRGATAIEYGLIAALIAVAAITLMGTLGSQPSPDEPSPVEEQDVERPAAP